VAAGRRLLAGYGCGTCHSIPGIPGADAKAAPPLDCFYERSYIAGRLAKRYGCGALITGESLGQVASQTMQALFTTDSATDMMVLRPCIGMDKEEIIAVARKIGTFETSILPYEDCCTVFTPRHPKTRPEISRVLEEEEKYNHEELENEVCP
jgi:thiamine biosynthesis protein ThiI